MEGVHCCIAGNPPRTRPSQPPEGKPLREEVVPKAPALIRFRLASANGAARHSGPLPWRRSYGHAALPPSAAAALGLGALQLG